MMSRSLSVESDRRILPHDPHDTLSGQAGRGALRLGSHVHHSFPFTEMSRNFVLFGVR